MESMKDRPPMNSQADNATALSQAGAFGSRQGPIFKLVLGGIVFVLLTVSIFLYQFSRIEHGEDTFTWSGIHFEYLWLMLLCLPFDTLASGLRIWLVCHVLQPGTGFWTCLKAEWANSGIAMLTPSQTGGGFGQIYTRDHDEPARRWFLLRPHFRRNPGLALFRGNLALDYYRWLDDRCPPLARLVSCCRHSHFASLSADVRACLPGEEQSRQRPLFPSGSDGINSKQAHRHCL